MTSASKPRLRRLLPPLTLAISVPLAGLVASHAGAQSKPAASGSVATVAPPKSSSSTAGAPPMASGVAGAPKIAPPSKAGPPPKPEELWVGPTTDELITQLEKRAIRDGLSGGRAAIGAIMAIPQIADDARAGAARAALGRIADALSKDGGNKELASEARTISRSIAPDIGTASGQAEEAKLGLVSAWRIVGGFKDTTGTGLSTAEGPEIAPPPMSDAKGDAKADKSKPAGKADAKADVARPISIDLFRNDENRWDDGPYDVGWRTIPSELISARGVPLEVLLYPRKEHCAYLATMVSLKSDATIVLRAASSGQVRAIWDGVTVDSNEERHSYAMADRLAAKVEATKGDHLFALKVCAGPDEDAGRVRARVTTEAGEAVPGIAFSSELKKLPATVTPAKSTKMITPLGKALAVAEKGATVDDALAAVLARRLGGADDAKNFKAQGLLDMVVTANPRPDVLAMAGMLATTRGSMTSWLNTALERSGSDPVYEPVARFARRTLAASRLREGYVDWTASTVANTELKTATDLDAQEIRAGVLDGLGQSEAAFNAYKTIWDTQKEQTPTSVLRAIASSSFGRPLIAAAAREQALTIWPRESVPEYVASKSLLGPDKLKAAAISSYRLTASADDLESVAAQLKSAGLDEAYRHLLLFCTDWTPNRKWIWSELVQSLATSPDKREREELTKVALNRARDLDPGSPFLRAEENLVYGEEHPDDEQYMPLPATFLPRRKGAPPLNADGSEPLLDVYDRELDWVRVVTVDDAGRVAQLIHYTREIVKAPKDASDLDEPHVPAEGDVAEVVLARVHHADGTIAVPQEIDEGDGIDIRWTDLKPGDVVEVATRSYLEMPIGDRGAAPFSFLDYAGGAATHPVLYNEVVVRSPKKHTLYTALLHEEAGKPDVHTSETDAKTGRLVERYVWNTPISLPEEPMQPKPTEIYPTIIGSQFRTWDDFVAWYKAGVSDFESVDPKIKRKAEEIVTAAKAKTRDEKLKAIFDWVADQVKYVNYVSAEQWLPNRPETVLDRLQGDCDDKAMLLMTMLKAIGVTDAQEVLVQTRYTGMPSIIGAKGAVAPMFDHGIAFLPGVVGGTGDRYLDATSPESRLGPLPAMDARAAAIRVTLGGPTPVVSLPASSPEEHGVNGTWSITLKADGAADISIDELHVGDSAFWLRTSLKQMSGAQTWLEKYHDVATLPQLQVLKAGILFDGELPQGKATLKFKAHSDALARREGTDLVLGFHFGTSTIGELAPLVKRVTPVVIPPHMAPSEQVIKEVFTPPAGYKVAELTAGGDVSGGKYGKASLTIETGPGGTIVVKRTFALDQSFIPVAEYDAWRKFLLQVDALFRREIRFVKA